jgi:hypothetical protein
MCLPGAAWEKWQQILTNLFIVIPAKEAKQIQQWLLWRIFRQQNFPDVNDTEDHISA